MEHLQELADALRETAMAFRWLAALAGAAGDSLKSSDVQNKADTLDNSADLLEAIAAAFKEAEDAGQVVPEVPDTADTPEVQPVEDMEDDDELDDEEEEDD